MNKQHEWNTLYKKLKSNPIKGISVEFKDDASTCNRLVFLIEETCGEFQFKMNRDFLSSRKETIRDDLGLIGVMSLDLSINHCFLTEGVSDFISKKLMQVGTDRPNVLGMVTLGGSALSRKILYSLFDHYTIVTDNDSTGELS